MKFHPQIVFTKKTDLVWNVGWCYYRATCGLVDEMFNRVVWDLKDLGFCDDRIKLTATPISGNENELNEVILEFFDEADEAEFIMMMSDRKLPEIIYRV